MAVIHCPNELHFRCICGGSGKLYVIAAPANAQIDDAGMDDPTPASEIAIPGHGQANGMLASRVAEATVEMMPPHIVKAAQLCPRCGDTETGANLGNFARHEGVLVGQACEYCGTIGVPEVAEYILKKRGA